MVRYNVSLIDRRRNFRKTVIVDADTALEAIKKAKQQDPNFNEVESCVPVKFLG